MQFKMLSPTYVRPDPMILIQAGIPVEVSGTTWLRNGCKNSLCCVMYLESVCNNSSASHPPQTGTQLSMISNPAGVQLTALTHMSLLVSLSPKFNFFACQL